MSVFLQDLPPILSSIAFASESWGWTALALGAGALLVLFLSYRSSPLRGGTKFFALALKAIGLLLLALALMEPVQLDEQPRKMRMMSRSSRTTLPA